MLFELSNAGADFIVVGAYALAAHGLPRATGDIDVWVRPSVESANKVILALQQFGAPMDQISSEALSSSDIVFQLGVAPRRIALLTSIDGVSFDDAWARRILVDVEGLRLPILSKEDFIVNKRAVGRPKDLADIAWIEGHE
jgi:hypothetical protein